ncbi:hypothetical protein ATJ93_4705 [Halopiger aswanensis]|uniref:CARDB protein n=2 Tax=Halopiger aswanensis TaxID=148449 RepID=A0A3R7DA54_9EURY|nr:hypothetical protein ATJ93_4705 [Halopiger aswanensis]
MFEIDHDAGSEQSPEWHINGDSKGLSLGPWFSTYHQYTGNEFWQYTVEKDCRVTAVLDWDGAGGNTVAWTINTDSAGLAPPQIRDTRPSTAERRILEPNTTLECEMDVTDPDGNLDRVVWWALAADIILDITSVSGREDTARITPSSEDIVQEGVTAWVISENGLITSSNRWAFARPDPDSQFTITGVETNSPIGGGETLEVDATIRNTGRESGGTLVDLIIGHDPKRVSTQSVGADPGEETEVTLEFEAGQPSGGREVFPGRVATRNDTHDFTIVVTEDDSSDGNEDGPTPATFVVQEMTTNSPVGGGENLLVETTIQNIGDETGRTDIQLIVGHSPQVEDSTMRTLEPGESATFTLVFQAGQPSGGREEFPVMVDTGADSATRTVAVVSGNEDGSEDGPTPATFAVQEMTTNSPVGGGENLLVETTIQNIGDETGRTDIQLIVGHSPQVEDSTMRTLEPGESATFTLTFQTGQPSGGREEFPVVVDTGADSATRTVTVVD